MYFSNGQSPGRTQACGGALPHTTAATDNGPLVANTMHDPTQLFKEHYSLTGEVLGTGMCGKVVSAVHRATRRKVAVKSFKVPELSVRDSMDLNNEIVSQSAMDHPNVARLKAVYRDEKRVLLVVEYLEGGDVFDHLERVGRFHESQAILVVRQLLKAVEHLHTQGFVHRDIKLENLAYKSAKQDKVKLIDFGLCTKWREGGKPMERCCGTEKFMAPEMLLGAYTNKVDLWCVGAAAYTMITGEEFRRHVVWTLSSFRSCSEEARDFVDALLTADPAARPSASKALEHAWLRDRTTSAPSTTPGTAELGSRLSWSARRPRKEGTHRVSPADLHQGSSADRAQPSASVRRSFWQRRMPSTRPGSWRVPNLWAAFGLRSKGAARVQPDAEFTEFTDLRTASHM
jgi:serine/threonine protein kinase